MAADLRLALVLAVLLLTGFQHPSLAAGAADPGTDLAAAGWEEDTPGRWNSRADRKIGILANGLTAEVTLSPGTGISWRKKGSWDPAGKAALSVELTSGGTNERSNDYREFDARFPVSVTAVFGKDRQDLPMKTRIVRFFRKILHGFTPGGIRLTYAFGNRAPVGSMYRLADEETVFILAGQEEKGKKVRSERNLKEDFLAAYRSPFFMLAEIALMAGVIYHGLNGFRIALFDLVLPAAWTIDRERFSVRLTILLAFILWLPAGVIMFRNFVGYTFLGW